MEMRFAILGGDERFRRLAALCRAEGHDVASFALGPEDAPGPAAAAEGADCVILPLPAVKGGRLNAPFAAAAPAPGPLLAQLAPGTLVCAGSPPPEVRTLCETYRLRLRDYGAREDFLLRNAELTAEGALSLLLAGGKALRGSRVLLAGYGRVGRALSRKLLALGAGVTVLARSSADRTRAALDGCRALPFGAAPGPWDAVVNTVPAPVFFAAALADFQGAALLDLASAPGGFDPEAVRQSGAAVRFAPGLPGQHAPAAAAEAVRAAVAAILEEEACNTNCASGWR